MHFSDKWIIFYKSKYYSKKKENLLYNGLLENNLEIISNRNKVNNPALRIIEKRINIK